MTRAADPRSTAPAPPDELTDVPDGTEDVKDPGPHDVEAVQARLLEHARAAERATHLRRAAGEAAPQPAAGRLGAAGGARPRGRARHPSAPRRGGGGRRAGR